ncbi:hypothetical protein B0H67DRAFT_102463 [Lasiosphaeris hirsuta]|uniref:Uncharacterized protein n=1 Tax=Lasiosphaeris hirsuta TaxID=260670 RepID=A0AA40AYK2_9PEZI|nr:hypothetical protein B0H67DRAFT_102463 [Lasiosphaeris hirsuta]
MLCCSSQGAHACWGCWGTAWCWLCTLGSLAHAEWGLWTTQNSMVRMLFWLFGTRRVKIHMLGCASTCTRQEANGAYWLELPLRAALSALGVKITRHCPPRAPLYSSFETWEGGVEDGGRMGRERTKRGRRGRDCEGCDGCGCPLPVPALWEHWGRGLAAVVVCGVPGLCALVLAAALPDVQNCGVIGCVRIVENVGMW